MKRLIALSLAVIALLSPLPAAQAVKTETAEQHIALPAGVSAEQLTAEYWLAKRISRPHTAISSSCPKARLPLLTLKMPT